MVIADILINTSNEDQHYPKSCLRHQVELKLFSCSCYYNYILATPMTISNGHHNRSTFPWKMSIKIYRKQWRIQKLILDNESKMLGDSCFQFNISLILELKRRQTCSFKQKGCCLLMTRTKNTGEEKCYQINCGRSRDPRDKSSG